MGVTLTRVHIPVDVKNNSPFHECIQWRNTRPATWPEIESAVQFAPTFRYTLHDWTDTDRSGRTVRLLRVVRSDGQTVDLFATYYATRVKCTDCEHHYASSYIQVTDQDGNTSSALPYCDYDGSRVLQYNRSIPGYRVHQSEPLLIGQHD